MEEIEADDNRFGDAADVDAARRAVIIAVMDWVNRCAELLDPVEDYATWESTAVVVGRFNNRLRSMPPRIPEDPAVHKPLNMPTKESVMAYVDKQLTKRRRPIDETVVSNAPPEKQLRRSRKSSSAAPEDDASTRRRLMPPPPPPGDRRPPPVVEVLPPLLPAAVDTATAAAAAAAVGGALAPTGSGFQGAAVKRKIVPTRAKSADYQKRYEERLRQVEEEDAEALRVEEQAKMWTERIRELEKEKEEKRRAIVLAEKKEEEEEQRKLNMQQAKEKHDFDAQMKRFEERQKQIQRCREDANNAVIWCRNRFDTLTWRIMKRRCQRRCGMPTQRARRSPLAITRSIMERGDGTSRLDGLNHHARMGPSRRCSGRRRRS